MLKIDRRRSSIEVIADMLRLGEAGKTEIMYSANMSYYQLQKYLNFLMELKLIDKVTIGNPMVTYRVTKKGLTLLLSIDSILEMLGGEESASRQIFLKGTVEIKAKDVNHQLTAVTERSFEETNVWVETQSKEDLMSDRRMLILPTGLCKKIDENRGNMSQAEFIEFLIDSRLTETECKVEEPQYVTREVLHVFEQDMKSLLRRFLDFFVSYGLDIGKESPKTESEELSNRLRELERDLASEGKSREAKIKWK